MTVPSEPVPVPEVVAGRPTVAVWVNELGGVTFELDGGREYVKVSPPEWAHHVVAERDRLVWAAAHARVPRVQGAGDRSRFAPAARRVARRRVSVRAAAVADRFTADRPARGLPRRRMCTQHADRRRRPLSPASGRCPQRHVDLGDLGVADRWADIAVAMLSLSWNYSGSWEGELLDAYGVDADLARIEVYQRLWNAGGISSH